MASNEDLDQMTVRVVNRFDGHISTKTLGELNNAKSEIWGRPDTSNPFDMEFESATLPSSLQLFNISAAPAVTVVPITGVDVYTQPAAGNVRIEAHKANKRSWLLMQPRGESASWFYGQTLTLSGTAGWVLRTRLASHIHLAGGSDNASSIQFVVCKDNAGKPDVLAAGNQVNSGISAGWEADAGTQQLSYFSRITGGAATVYADGPDLDNITPADFEIAFVLRSGAASVAWDLWYRSPALTQYVAAATMTAAGMSQGDLVWVGWYFRGVDANSPSSPILSADYMRFEDTAANFLP